MKILALITARGGSKRLPGKNIRTLGSKPLIAWSIDTVRTVPEVCDILVSTDDIEIKTVSERYGAYVPWLRPEELATDTASSVDVALHAIDWYENEKGPIDGVLLLQPTSPFRAQEKIKEGIKRYIESEYTPVLGVSPTHAHPKWTFKIENESLTPYLEEHGLNTRSQDLEPAYVVNGSFYLISCADLRKEKSFIGKNTIPLIIDSDIESLDIDTESDWQYAEYCISKI